MPMLYQVVPPSVEYCQRPCATVEASAETAMPAKLSASPLASANTPPSNDDTEAPVGEEVPEATEARVPSPVKLGARVETTERVPVKERLDDASA